MSQNAAHLQVQVPGFSSQFPNASTMWSWPRGHIIMSERTTQDGKRERPKLLLARLLADITRGLRCWAGLWLGFRVQELLSIINYEVNIFFRPSAQFE